MKKLFYSALTAVAIFSGASSVDAFNIQINGKACTIPKGEQQPYINKDKRTMVPIRLVSQALGVSDQNITWDAKKQTATIKAESTIRITVGKREVQVNDIKIPMDTAAELINGRVCVPVRYIVENLGANVKWDNKTNTVQITKSINNSNVVQKIDLNSQQKLAKTLAEQMQREINSSINFKIPQPFPNVGMISFAPKEGFSSVWISFYEDQALVNVNSKIGPTIGDVEQKILKAIFKHFYPKQYEEAYTRFNNTFKNGKEYDDSIDGRYYASKRFPTVSTAYIKLNKGGL